jgi:hypothetical protein
LYVQSYRPTSFHFFFCFFVFFLSHFRFVVSNVYELDSMFHADVVLIKQLLELLPSAGDDSGARNALWSILSRLSLAHSKAHVISANHSRGPVVNENGHASHHVDANHCEGRDAYANGFEDHSVNANQSAEDHGVSANSVVQVALTLAGGSDVLLDNLLDHQNMELDEADGMRGFSSKLETVCTSLSVSQFPIPLKFFEPI